MSVFDMIAASVADADSVAATPEPYVQAVIQRFLADAKRDAATLDRLDTFLPTLPALGAGAEALFASRLLVKIVAHPDNNARRLMLAAVIAMARLGDAPLPSGTQQ